MNFDEELPKKPPSHQLGAELSTFSIAELEDYAAALDAEKNRVEEMIRSKKVSRNAADSVFKS